MLVLASSSKYRRVLFERLQLQYVSIPPEIDERAVAGESPRATAIRLAELKARTVAASRPGDVVIGSDQVASLEDEPLGKPGSREAALEQLIAMRGRTALFHTALCVIDTRSGRIQIDEVPTVVRFRSFSERQAERYLAIDRPYDCAGSAKIESLGIALVERVESTDPTALIGLPLIALVSMLQEAGIDVP